MADGAKNEKLAYLLDVYKLYHGHINTMFNFFLVMTGFLTNAYIQALINSGKIQPRVTVTIASISGILSLVSLLVHLKCRRMLDTIEAGLLREEEVIFSPSESGFLKAPTGSPKLFNPWYMRHKYQFPFMYLLVTFAFFAGAIYAGAC